VLLNPARVVPLYCLVIVAFATQSSAQSTLIPLITRRDMVFDYGGKYFYITTSDGYVRPYNLSTNQLEIGYNLGGSLNGIDIARDDSFLLVAQNDLQASQVVVHRLSLITGAVTNIGFAPSRGEAANGAWAVAIASNGLAMVTSAWGGSGFAQLHQINLATNAISVRTDVPGSANNSISSPTQIHRSADGTRLSFMETDISSGPIFQYDATTDTFGLRVQTNFFTDSAGAAVSRDGSLLGTRLPGNGMALDAAATLNFLHSFHDPDSGITFDATTDTLYAVSSSAGVIIAYDTNTFVEKFRLDIGESISPGVIQFGTGNLVASPDGRHLALSTASGVRIFATPKGMSTQPPSPTFGTPRDMVFDHAGQRLYITTAEGFVWPYNLSSGVFETPFNIGGSLAGFDIAVDDSFLLVAQPFSGIAQGAFYKVDLITRAATNINYTHADLEWGACDAAIALNGLAFVTTGFKLPNSSPLRQIDLANNSIATCSNVPGSGLGMVSQGTEIHRSADRTLLFFMEVNNSSGPLFTYNATSNSFGAAFYTNWFLDHAGAAVNRNGELLGIRYYPDRAFMSTASSFNVIQTFKYLDAGVAFDAVQDTLYGVESSRSQIIAYDTNTFVEKFRFDIGEKVTAGVDQFGPGTLVASQDGHHLALITPTTVRVYYVPAVQLIGVVSEKSHGSAGAFDINLALDGPPAIECRSGGASGSYTVIFTFGLNLTTVGGASVTSGVGGVASSMIDSNDTHRYIVNLTGVTNAQYLKVTLTDVNDSAGNFSSAISATMGVLIGDVNAGGLVDGNDVSAVQNHTRQSVNNTNFRYDVNTSGGIDGNDVSITQGQTRISLPSIAPKEKEINHSKVSWQPR
jgi:hypothetical protein